MVLFCFFFFKQKTAYEMRISDWSSDVCSSDLPQPIDKVLARATLAIHHGGSGMSLACCSAGRPQLALPIHEETLLTAQALSRIGVGSTIAHKDLEADGAARLADRKSTRLNSSH